MPKASRTPALIRASTISSPPVRWADSAGPAAPSVAGAGTVVAIGSSPLRSGSGYTTDPAAGGHATGLSVAGEGGHPAQADGGRPCRDGGPLRPRAPAGERG